MVRRPPSCWIASYGSRGPALTMSKTRWNIASASTCATDCASWSRSRVTVTICHALITATTTTTSVVTPATCFALMLKGSC